MSVYPVHYSIYKQSILYDMYTKGYTRPLVEYTVWTPYYDSHSHSWFVQNTTLEQLQMDDYLQTAADVMTGIAFFLFWGLVADLLLISYEKCGEWYATYSKKYGRTLSDTVDSNSQENDVYETKEEDKKYAVIVRGLPGTGKKKALKLFLRRLCRERNIDVKNPGAIEELDARIYYWKKYMYDNDGEYRYNKYFEKEYLDKSMDQYCKAIQKGRAVVCIIDYFSNIETVYRLAECANHNGYMPIILDMERPQSNEDFQKLYDGSKHRVPVKKSKQIDRSYEEFDDKAYVNYINNVVGDKMNGYKHLYVPMYIKGVKSMQEAIDSLF